MSITPEALEAEFSLPTAATRLDFLSRRDDGATTLNTVQDTDDDSWAASLKDAPMQLDVAESLELLALGEVVARKAHDSRIIGIRAALRGGAGWEQIGAALGTSPQAAYDTYVASLSDQLDADAAASARELAGARPGS
ncbi:hypothetical protein [Blastococcus sp. TF02A-30]|uniref:hypothetical protein n=1 Tax=Blastococcus sp. TF02A-30 TaxID=2250580 RepID=UPI000DEA427F|nr:hypothetical protein [Blastococcus sp. TF02A-30]RBY91096.1 hypothetical protein DQ241_05340 [Blastococcus sp. TF02A-30]